MAVARMLQNTIAGMEDVFLMGREDMSYTQVDGDIDFLHLAACVLKSREVSEGIKCILEVGNKV